MSQLLPPPILRSVLQPPAVIRSTLSVQQGLPGPPGIGTVSDYLHNQAVASAVWIINHNLNRDVLVSLRTTGGVEFHADIVQISLNQVQALLAAPLAGTARVI